MAHTVGVVIQHRREALIGAQVTLVLVATVSLFLQAFMIGLIWSRSSRPEAAISSSNVTSTRYWNTRIIPRRSISPRLHCVGLNWGDLKVTNQDGIGCTCLRVVGAVS